MQLFRFFRFFCYFLPGVFNCHAKVYRRKRSWIRSMPATLEKQPVTVNPIVAENQLQGTPECDWDVDGAGDPSIQGFATDISVNQGLTIGFKINVTRAAPYDIEIYRLGYYGGLGARHVATIRSSRVRSVSQPDPVIDPLTGLIDAGNWEITASWDVPTSATSGIYIARLVRKDTGGASHIPFIVRDDASHSEFLFQTSDTTWQAYNDWGGNSLYVGKGPGAGFHGEGRAYAVSYNRPLNTRATKGGMGSNNSLFHAEYSMVRWLESNGYDISYCAGVDTDRRGVLIQQHRVFLSVGHDEYWSDAQFVNIMAARDAGVHLAFLTGNTAYWKTRWTISFDGSETPYRTLVCYKETLENAKVDPSPSWTGTWMDSRFSPPADGGRPQNQLIGTLFTVNRGSSDIGSPFEVPSRMANLRFWRNTPVAKLLPGQTATVGTYEIGFEWDEDIDNGFRPAGLIQLSSSRLNVREKIQDFGSTFMPDTATHSLTLYRAASGALVFSAGTIQYSWGLDGNYEGPLSAPVLALQQATVNLFADMGVQPGTLNAGLVPARESTDSTPPSSVIAAPLDGTSLVGGTPIVVTGTAIDVGGVVAGVEVSVDGGMTWHPAVGTTIWNFFWVPNINGKVVILSRATDDSCNIEAPSPGVTVTVSGSPRFHANVRVREPGARKTSAGKGERISSITIAIPTYNRAEELRQTLFSLRRIHTNVIPDYEILVIDNNSTDRTPQIVNEFAPFFGGLLRYVVEPRQGLTHARNRAVAEARHAIVAFLDDDVEVDANWLLSLVNAHDADDYAAVGGKAYLIYPCPRPKWLDARSEGFLSAVDLGPQSRLADADELFGLNLSVRKDWVLRVGPFRSDLGRIGNCLLSGEETELLERMTRAGGKLRYEPSAVVGHRVSENRLRRRWFWSRCYWGQRGLVRLLPESQISCYEIARASWHVILMGKRVLRACVSHGPFSAETFVHTRSVATRLGAWVGLLERIWSRLVLKVPAVRRGGADTQANI